MKHRTRELSRFLPMTNSNPGQEIAKTVLIFDGDCGFCTSTANWIVKHSKISVTAVPYQWAKLEESGLTAKQASAEVQLVSDGSIFSGHYCMAKLLKLQPNILVRSVGKLMTAPGINSMSALVYKWIAANRHKLPGGTPACEMPRS